MTHQFRGHFVCLLILVLFATGNYACNAVQTLPPSLYRSVRNPTTTPKSTVPPRVHTPAPNPTTTQKSTSNPQATTTPATVCADEENHATSSSVEAMIANGLNVRMTELPHQVALFSVAGNDVICGGAILTPHLVITAAHCILKPSPKEFKVIAGLTNLTLLDDKNYTQKQVREVAFFYVHAQYDKVSLANDIAIVVLDSPLVYNDNVRNITLPKAKDTLEREVIVAGWGETENGSYPVQLKKAKLRTVKYCKCKKYYEKSRFPVTVKHICVGKQGSGICQGDSGGPVLCKRSNSPVWILCGIVSWGTSNLCGNRPGVCTRVASFTDWIEQVENEVKTMDAKIENVVRELVTDGLNAKDDNGNTPLHRAAALTDKRVAFEVIKVLINMGANVWARNFGTDTKDNCIFLHSLFFNGTTITPAQFHDLATFLISKELSPIFNSRTKGFLFTGFQLAVMSLEIETRTLSLLKNNGVDFKAVSLLVGSIVNSATYKNRTPRLVSDLVSFGADPMHLFLFSNRSNLHQAARNHNVELVKLFLGFGLDVNAKDVGGNTPLHDAIGSYDQTTTNALNTVQILMRNGANRYIANIMGNTPTNLLNKKQGWITDKDKIYACLLRGSSC